MKAPLVFIATQADKTRENKSWMNAAEDLAISLLIFSLDELEFKITSEEMDLRFTNVSRDKASTSFCSFFAIDRENRSLELSAQSIQEANAIFIIRRLGREISIEDEMHLEHVKLQSKGESYHRNQLQFIQRFLNRLDKIAMIESLGIRTLNSAKAIQTCMNKALTLSTVSDCTLNFLKTPQSYLISDVKSFLESTKKLEGPVVIKPIYGSKGKDMLLIGEDKISGKEQRQETLRKVQLLLKKSGSLLIQPFLAEMKGDMRFLVYKRRLIGMMDRIAAKEDQWQFNIHKGSMCKEVAVSEAVEKKILQDSVRIAAHLETDLCGIDILHDESNYYFLEANSIPGLITIADYYIGTQKSIFHEILSEFL